MNTNTLEIFNKFVGQQGGTIHQAEKDYLDMPLEKQEEFCELCLQQMFNLTDLYHFDWFVEHKKAKNGD